MKKIIEIIEKDHGSYIIDCKLLLGGSIDLLLKHVWLWLIKYEESIDYPIVQYSHLEKEIETTIYYPEYSIKND